ncbi:CheR family methyltransferase [Sphingomonas jeddahensis]|uniref:protein-glutamate O-methyltransferase n=1 Tax=Sphingomonas jeddahensis TaxID=1915074 RepID=A0A1V2EXU8_9SPHN|nr:CheR family methyltransferase [Sphingomonas jeddahensis]ONF97019.1 Chemotaxis protein methyltransferase [Sphingomonas jeddahensis]
MAEKTPPDPEFEALLRYIQESRGLDFRGYKRTSLRRRITLRMEAVGAEDFSAYRSRLEAQPGEFENLLNTVLINVTSFFRDGEAWDVLRDHVIPSILGHGDSDRPIRVWSVGCASGEEPYSIAMLFAEAMGTKDFCRRVKIYATDLDEEALRTARVATYAPRDVEGVPPELLEKYFERTNNHYVFERELRKCVIFGQHNVVHDAPISRIDLLTCRNLLIYLEAETQSVVLPRLHYALTRDGYLFLGKAETQLARSSLFRPVEMKHRIFAKVPQEWRRPMGSFAASRMSRMDPPMADVRLLEAIVNETGNALLVVDEAGSVALANLPARHLLGVGDADIGRPFQDLPISYRPIELRGPIEEVFRQRVGVRLEDQEYRLNQAEVMRLTIDLRPLFNADGSVYAVLLSFLDQTRLHTLHRELEAAQENLEHSIEELQSANEELETTNEELQSTNEELETTNEELQSTNEELETLNEEARSSNEEMESVNEELRIQAEQASAYRLHLESVLRAMNGGIIVLDPNHVIRSWNRWSESTWGLRAEDVIGTKFDLLDIGLPIHKLRDALSTVQFGRAEYVDEMLEGVDRRGRRILCRIRVSPLSDEDGSTLGLVLIFQDLTEERSKEEYARYLGRIMGRALNEIYFLDPKTLRFTLTNDGAQKKLGYSDAQLRQMTLLEVAPALTQEAVDALLASLFSGAEKEIVFETSIRGKEREYPAEMCMQLFGDEEPPILVAVLHDTSERRPVPQG